MLCYFTAALLFFFLPLFCPFLPLLSAHDMLLLLLLLLLHTAPLEMEAAMYESSRLTSNLIVSQPLLYYFTTSIHAYFLLLQFHIDFCMFVSMYHSRIACHNHVAYHRHHLPVLVGALRLRKKFIVVIIIMCMSFLFSF